MRARNRILCGAALGGAFASGAVLFPVIAAQSEKIPNFAPDSATGWLKPPASP